ncbi:MAG: hypothetical protein AABW73_02105 [Nanoarchaeota archaeon]
MSGTLTIYTRAQAERLAEERRFGLVAKTDDELKDLFHQGRERGVTGPWGILSAPQEFYDGMAAAKILVDRHGEDYVLGLEGRRKPKTITEKVVYVLFNHLPKI